MPYVCVMKKKTLWAIYKYPFVISDNVEITLPAGSDILSIQIQNDIPTMWARVDLNQELMHARRFRILGTGQPTDECDLSYICTIQYREFVGHIFEAI